MPAFAALPPMLQLLIVGLVGGFLGALTNWATYRFAWFNPREISPWGPSPVEAKARRLTDRLPIVGWLGLRREHLIHGRGFWIRPMLVELAMAVGLAMLYRWEVHCERLVVPQIEDWLRLPLPAAAGWVPITWLQSTFLNHAILIALMAAASFIDIDEKIIPDEITVPGTLVGLLLAALLPTGLLPCVVERLAPEPISTHVDLPPAAAGLLEAGNLMYVEPVTLASPIAWPAQASNWQSLLLGQACWWLWCFAITPRIYRGRRGMRRGLAILMRRVLRSLMQLPLSAISIIGSLSIAAVWWLGGAAWVGLLTALVGLAVSGGLVWAVRLGGTAALNREAMGFGDVTLMMMVGTFVGWQAGIIIFFLAPFAGLVVGLMQLVLRRDDEIPYGPFLCLSTLFVVVRWADVWNRSQFAFSAGWLVPVVLIFCVVMLVVMLFLWQQIKNALFQ
ncbi:MAG: A24 family peptidase [Planctomycetota bacterium]